MPLYQLNQDQPDIHASVYIAPGAHVMGKVRLAAHTSIWFGAVLRGDNEWITVEENSNVQEGCVLHTDMGWPLLIEKNVSIGHQAMLHGCIVGEGALIGIQAIILNGAKIGRNCLVGAGALVTEHKIFPDNMLILGSPAKAVRLLTEDEILNMHHNIQHYVQRSAFFKNHLKQVE